MNPPDITTLLNMSESDALDFKSGQYKFASPATDDEKSELLKDIIAFANSFKTGDAFVVIGVTEKNQRKDKVIGVTPHLKDNEIQQFVNTKANRRIEFLIHSTTAEGQPIDIIQIAHRQERPIFLTKNFGKLKANDVFIRSGSSTAIATPDQVAAMVKADHNASLGEARIALEWADPKEPVLLGTEITVTGIRLTEPPPPAPTPKPTDPPSREGRASEGISRDLMRFLQPPEVRTVLLTGMEGPTEEELSSYAQSRSLISPLRVRLKNIGARNAANVKVRITIPKIERVIVLDSGELPERPQGGALISAIHSHTVFRNDTDVRDDPTAWVVEIDAKTIQPQDEFWSDPFYIATGSDRTIEAVAKIFADDLAKPIEVALKINARNLEREITPEDLQATWD
jgi:hypothetical protein